MNGADTAWIIVATALVLFMSLPGLALFYGGLVRARNVLSVFMHVYAIAALMSVLWLVLGYSIAFGEGNALWGGLGKMFLGSRTMSAMYNGGFGAAMFMNPMMMGMNPYMMNPMMMGGMPYNPMMMGSMMWGGF